MILSTLLTSAFAADLSLPAPSPAASVSQTVGTVQVTVDYSSPGAKEREVWGGLVPYGKLWRTGANGATTVTLDGDATIGGQPVPAGRYSLFTEPGADSFTVILNRNADQGGTGQYDKALDVARFTAEPVEVPARERLTFLFVDTDMDSSMLHLDWAGMAVPIPIEVDSDARANDSIDAYASRAAREMAQAARWKSDHGDTDAGMRLIEKSLALESNWYGMWAKANIQKAAGDAKGAYKTLKATRAMGEKEGNFFYADRVAKALESWPRK